MADADDDQEKVMSTLRGHLAALKKNHADLNFSLDKIQQHLNMATGVTPTPVSRPPDAPLSGVSPLGGQAR